MTYLSSAETAEKWAVSERMVRSFCAQGRVAGAIRSGRSWRIPADAKKPERAPRTAAEPDNLLSRLRREQRSKLPGGIYHRVQIDLTYNSNHIEGSRLTRDQTLLIFETNTIGAGDSPVGVDDVVETANHFRCIDLIIERAEEPLTERLIKQLHGLLKAGTSDSREKWFAVGDYKRLPNEVGAQATAAPEEVADRMRSLLAEYNAKADIALADILDFHVRFERIHPFQDGNGRVGRLIMFKECLRRGILPFIITDDLKAFYYRGLQQWGTENGYLTDTCLTAQDRFRRITDYFRIPG